MRHGAKPAICNCDGESRPFRFGIALGGLKFQYEQQSPIHHSRGCKYHGINKQNARVLKAQFPLGLGWFSTRITLASIEMKRGMGDLVGSITVRNLVRECAIKPELDNTIEWIRSSASRTEIIQGIQAIERTILSLYRDGKASPYDRNLYGRTDCDVRLIDSSHSCSILTYRRCLAAYTLCNKNLAHVDDSLGVLPSRCRCYGNQLHANLEWSELHSSRILASLHVRFV